MNSCHVQPCKLHVSREPDVSFTLQHEISRPIQWLHGLSIAVYNTQSHPSNLSQQSNQESMTANVHMSSKSPHMTLQLIQTASAKEHQMSCLTAVCRAVWYAAIAHCMTQFGCTVVYKLLDELQLVHFLFPWHPWIMHWPDLQQRYIKSDTASHVVSTAWQQQWLYPQQGSKICPLL